MNNGKPRTLEQLISCATIWRVFETMAYGGMLNQTHLRFVDGFTMTRPFCIDEFSIQLFSLLWRCAGRVETSNHQPCTYID